MSVPRSFLVAFTLTLMACAGGSNGGESDTPSIAPATPAPTPGVGETSAPQPAAPAPGAQPTAAAPTPRPGGEQTKAPPASPPSSSGAQAAGAGSDTARGRVAVVGSTPITQVVLRPAGGRSITLTGLLADEIGSASGADVWVRGRRTGERSFEVARYAVRSVDGVVAVTGTLVADGERLAVVDDDGRRHTIVNPPAPLREHVGARVWVSGDLATGIAAYGVLRRRR